MASVELTTEDITNINRYNGEVAIGLNLSKQTDSNTVKVSKEVKKEITRRKDYDSIVFWILLWPFSALGYLINDFIIDMMRKFVDKIYTVYDKIADKMLSAAGLKD